MWHSVIIHRGGSRVLGKGGSGKYIHNWGRVREGACPSRDSKGVWGSADSSPVGSGAKPQPLFAFAFILHEIHSDIQYKHHAISGLLEPALAWIATKKLFTFHNAMVPTATS